jgi:uncharacterized RDD family membrane protein YckC
MTDNKRWYFREGSRISGPHSRDQLIALFVSGKVPSHTKIFLIGKEYEATKLSSVYQLPERSPLLETASHQPNHKDNEISKRDGVAEEKSALHDTLGEESTGNFPSTNRIGLHSIKTFHPWRRYFARGFDLLLISILLGPLLKPFTSESEIPLVGTSTSALSTWYFTTLWTTALFNALCISRFGTTPGKWFLNIRVLTQERTPLMFKKALGREVIVLLLGLGGGIFVLTLLSLGVTVWFIKTKGATPWDRYALAASEFEPISLFKLALTLPFLVMYSTAVGVLTQLVFDR